MILLEFVVGERNCVWGMEEEQERRERSEGEEGKTKEVLLFCSVNID